jgi:protease I
MVTGRTVTGHPHVCGSERAGGTYSEKPAVRDGRIITAQFWKSHPEFYREVPACPAPIASPTGRWSYRRGAP